MHHTPDGANGAVRPSGQPRGDQGGARPLLDEVLAAPVLHLAAWVRRRDLSPVELVERHLRRVEAVEPQLNALAARRFDRALDEAREAERALHRGDPVGPLHGVPCTVKEFLAVEGMPWTAGCPTRRGMVAPRDATLVARLKRAGAIVIGSGNAPEGGLWHETDNLVYGRTHNPWDLHRTPGGSSGGDAALVASGCVPFAVGSDVGGSIRIPAAFCGIAGHKPTGGLIPSTGHFPPGPPGEPMMSCGPLARYVNDLWTLLGIMAGPDGVDPLARAWPLGDPAAVDLRNVTVFPLKSNGRARPRPPVRDGVRAAVDALLERGARAERLRVEGLERAFEIWVAMLRASGVSYDEVVGGGRPVHLGRELWRWPLGRSQHAGGVLLLVALEKLASALRLRTDALAAMGPVLRDALEAEIGPNGVIVHPVYTRTAPRHRGMLLQPPWDIGCTTLFNVTTMPVTVVPVGLDDRGLPIAVQIAARRGNDHLTLAVGAALQEAFGTFTPIEPRVGRPAPLGIRLVRERPSAPAP